MGFSNYKQIQVHIYHKKLKLKLWWLEKIKLFTICKKSQWCKFDVNMDDAGNSQLVGRHCLDW